MAATYYFGHKNAQFLEKHCLMLNGFKDLRRGRGFMDVTLACEDVQQIVAHTYAICLKAVLKRLLANKNQ